MHAHLNFKGFTLKQSRLLKRQSGMIWRFEDWLNNSCCFSAQMYGSFRRYIRYSSI